MPFTDKPWDGSASRWPTPEAYCSASLIDENPSGQPKTKALCKLPVKEPDGTYNTNALKAAFAALRGGRGGVQASGESKRKAMSRLMRLYSEAGLGQPAQTATRSQPELRSVPFVDIDAESDGSKFTGYAAVFDDEADLGGFTESVARGAFRKVLAELRNVPMLWNHNPDYPLATTKAGTLRLAEDTKGLRVEANLGGDFVSEFVRERVRRGEVDGMSYGFVAGQGNSRIEHRAEKPHRVLTGFVRLLDVSPTWDPAYATTSAELRSMTSIAIDLQQLLEGEDQQLEDGAGPPDDPEMGERGTSGATNFADWKAEMVAAKRERELSLNEKGGHDDAS